MQVMVVTVARSDYSILRPLLRRLAGDTAFTLSILATGMHLSPAHGATISHLEADGFFPEHRVEMLLSSDSAAGTSKSMGVGMIGFADVFSQAKPDLLIVMGDRFEMFAAAAAALPFRIPVAHLHGGELSEGAIDDAMRHAITKLSHLHFVSTARYRQRVIQLGESPDRVITSGAPALDNFTDMTFLDRGELEAQIKLSLDTPPLIVTLHPTTLQPERALDEVKAVLEAVEKSGHPAVFTAPNADAAGYVVRNQIERLCATKSNLRFIPNLGLAGYYSLMRSAAAMIGNSSSGIIEAASFRLPVVNVGDRQKGRDAGVNVLHVPSDRETISTAINHAIDPKFRASLADMINPYGDGTAVSKIIATLKSAPITPEICSKRFHNLAVAA